MGTKKYIPDLEPLLETDEDGVERGPLLSALVGSRRLARRLYVSRRMAKRNCRNLISYITFGVFVCILVGLGIFARIYLKLF